MLLPLVSLSKNCSTLAPKMLVTLFPDRVSKLAQGLVQSNPHTFPMKVFRVRREDRKAGMEQAQTKDFYVDTCNN
jgi:hypothetical protein